MFGRSAFKCKVKQMHLHHSMELFYLPEQTQIREDCKLLHVADKLGNDEDEKFSVVGDLESMVTFFSKSRGEAYTTHNGWLDLLQPLLALKMAKPDLYDCLYALVNKWTKTHPFQTSREMDAFPTAQAQSIQLMV